MSRVPAHRRPKIPKSDANCNERTQPSDPIRKRPEVRFPFRTYSLVFFNTPFSFGNAVSGLGSCLLCGGTTLIL